MNQILKPSELAIIQSFLQFNIAHIIISTQYKTQYIIIGCKG